MKSDERLRNELARRRADVDQRREERDQARRRLQAAGREAYAALQQAGLRSETVAREIGVRDSTVRKLNSDGDRSGWRPLSHDLYVRLDRYMRTRFQRLDFNLARLRKEYDEADEAVAAAERAVEAAPFDHDEAGRRVWPLGKEAHLGIYDLGVLLLANVPAERLDRSLHEVGDALADLFNEGREGPLPSVRISTEHSGNSDRPPLLVLERGEMDGAESRPRDPARRWLVGVSPLGYALDDDDVRPFLSWLSARLPLLAAEALDRHAMQARCLAGAWSHRWPRMALNGMVGCLASFAVLIAMMGLALLLAVSFLPGLHLLARAAGRVLFRPFGATFAHARSSTGLDDQASRAARDLLWMRDHCHRVAVVAHGLGVAAAHRLLHRGTPDSVGLFATMGSSLRTFRFVRALQERTGESQNGAGWATVTALSTLGLLSASAVFVLAVVVLLSGPPRPGLAAFAVLGSALLVALAAGAIAWHRRELRGDLVAVRRDVVDELLDEPVDTRWVDFSTAADLAADGPYLAAASPLGETSVEVVHHASAWADRRDYFRPTGEALFRLVEELATLAPPPVPLKDTVRLARDPEQRRRRLRWRIAARWASLLSGWSTAIALTRDAVPAGIPGGVWFLVLWTLCAVAVYGMLLGVWRVWDRAHHLYHTAPSSHAAQPDQFHLSIGFVALLELLALAVAGPPLAMAGLGNALLRVSSDVLAVLDVDHPVAHIELVLIALILMILLGAAALGWLLALPVLRRRLRRRASLPSPVAAAGVLLRKLPPEGLEVGGARYRAVPIGWDVSVRRRWSLRLGRPFRSPNTALMLLRNDTVLLDLREGHIVGAGRDRMDAHVRGDRVYLAAQPTVAGSAPRLARHADWRAFRRDLPELLGQVSDRQR